MDNCRGLSPIVKVIKRGLFPIFQIGIPIVLILLGTIDLGKAVISSEEKQVKEAQSMLIKRLIYAALVFFVVTIVSALMTMVGQGATAGNEIDNQSWWSCWKSV